ncbi:MAG TPA: IS1595 family transposase [Nitrospirota bacterium]|nr:IS1595 family transposase [Nitrospirota bacterium]
MNIIEVYRKFPTPESCLKHLEKARWNSTPVCPYCASTRTTAMPKELRHHCNNCKTSFSVTVGTIFQKTKVDLQKWFLAISIILNAKKGLSSRQLARDLEVNRNTAWYMAMRIRKAMTQFQDQTLLQGIVEMDETYIGGKPRKGNNDDGAPNKRGRGTKKIPVVGMAERGGKVRASVSKKHDLNATKLSALVRRNVNVTNTILMTDEYKGYLRMSSFIDHRTINHQQWYVDGDIHTNTIESFWALLKRGIVGQYHKVSLHHLPKYIDEFCYRYNNRKNENVFDMTLNRALEVRI